MEKAIKDFHDYVMFDVLGHIDRIHSKAMFGGYGIYLNGIIFGLITDSDELRFKANDKTKNKYEALGGTQFVYTGHQNKKATTMPYWQVPEEIMEDKEKISLWVDEAVNISKKK